MDRRCAMGRRCHRSLGNESLQASILHVRATLRTFMQHGCAHESMGARPSTVRTHDGSETA
eukprot:15433139-Alexandrium_andersonii.AAC.1